LLLQGKVLLGYGFYGGLPPLSLVNLLHVTGGGFGSYWFPFLLVARRCWVVCLPPGLPSLPLIFKIFPFSWVLSFYKVWHGFINNNYKSGTSISQHPMVVWWQGQTIINVACFMTKHYP
jgi:hypothetical protein